jgi:uncharacterized coiled-coil DUF342 family protein
MNAVLGKSQQVTESAHMPVNERDDHATQIAELPAHVRHIQSDITDIKAELRTLSQKTDERFEKLNEKFDGLKDSLASAKIWALGLYIALAGSMFYVLAHGFTWL